MRAALLQAAAGNFYGYQNCSAAGSGNPVLARAAPAGVGICTSATSPRAALVSYFERLRSCTKDVSEVFCSLLEPESGPATECVDVSSAGALQAIQRSLSLNRDVSVNILGFAANAGECALVESPAAEGALTFQMPRGNIGSASGAGTSVPLIAMGGTITVRETCDGESCFSSVERLRLQLADTTVLGTRLSGLTITNTRSIPRQNLGDGIGEISAQALNVVAVGRLNGVDSVLTVQNRLSWEATFIGSGFRLSGTMELLATDLAGRLIPITVTVDILAPAAAPQVLACAALSPAQRLLGFEDAMSWTSTAASLSLVTSNITQGCGALGVAGRGYIPFSSNPFSTIDLPVKSSLSVDLFIPDNQPNPFWLGALQMYFTCPSANTFNQYIGQVELTGLPQKRFSTLRFPLPRGVARTLKMPLNDCTFGFALNVNHTNRTWVIDNLRFSR